jgi:hypothetical protein
MGFDAGGELDVLRQWRDVRTAVSGKCQKLRSQARACPRKLTSRLNGDLATVTPSAANLAYQGASTYLTLAPGTYQFRAVPAGTAAAARAAAVTIRIPSFVLVGGTGRTIVTADNNVGGAPLRAFVLGDR